MTLSNVNGTEAQGEEILTATVDLAQQLWGERLIAAYALGSLAHGGFRPLVSDIDIGFVLADPLAAGDADVVKQLMSAIRASGRPFSDRLSIFWGSVGNLSGGRFPPLDRLDLDRFGRLVRGRDVRAQLPAPTQRELVTASAEFALWRLDREDVATKLKDPGLLLHSDPKTLTKLILYPVRFLFTARTGDVGRNDAAVEHFAARAESPAAELARTALGWRDQAPAPADPAAVRTVSTGLLPLYREFMLDYEQRMRDYDRADLADAFRDWRARLQA